MSVLLEPGAVLSARYKIIRTIGQGGMGAVYLASDERIPEKTWAIKELWDFGDPSTRELVQSQFKMEASILASLDHRRLPRITDFFVESDREYLVMDLVEGKTLEEMLKEAAGPLEVEQALSILKQLMEVLGYLHGKSPPVIFRDVKPANIMVGEGGEIKLIDFGIARIFQEGKEKDTVIMGTPGFAAPEQYGKGQSDVRSDIFGLGATMYFVLTGLDPGDNPFHFDPVSSINPKVYPRLEKAVLKCVQLDPADRFSSVEELSQYLFSPEARTTDISPLQEGTRPEPALPQPVTLEPPDLNFGILKKGETRKRRFLIRGAVSHVTVEKDQPWIRVYPSLVDGMDQEVGVTVYTQSMGWGGRYGGEITLHGEGVSLSIPIRVEIEPRHLNFLSYVLVFFFTWLSLLPGVGFIGFFYDLVAYFSIPQGERKSLKIFLYVSLFATLLWTVVISLWVGIYYLGWFKDLIFF